MDRITRANLDWLVERINKATGNPLTTYTKTKDGKYKANIGNYHLSGAYGGWALEQICSDGGGVHSTFGCGHVPKRDLYNRMRAFLEGLEAGKSVKQ